MNQALRRRSTWVVLGLILGMVGGSPLVTRTDLGWVPFLLVVAVYSIVEYRHLGSGEGYHWSIILAFVAGWLGSLAVFGLVVP